jgi:hypothetical protein
MKRPRDRVEALLEDILAGPAELAAVLGAQAAAVADIPLGALSRPTWRLIGMGSSRFAALDAPDRGHGLGDRRLAARRPVHAHAG